MDRLIQKLQTEKEIRMKRILLVLAVAAGVLGGLQRAQATSLTPGGMGTPDGIAPSGSNLVVVADTGSQSYANGANSGTIQEYVLKGDTSKNSLGGLDFVFQVKVSGGSLPIASLSNFSGVSLIDVSQVAGPITLGGGGTILGTGTKQAATADWTSDSSTVDFFFIPSAKSGTTTYVMVVRTNVSQFTNGSIDLSGIGLKGFAPSPEPASMVLLASCFAGLAGPGLWRRLRRRGQSE